MMKLVMVVTKRILMTELVVTSMMSLKTMMQTTTKIMTTVVLVKAYAVNVMMFLRSLMIKIFKHVAYVLTI